MATPNFKYGFVFLKQSVPTFQYEIHCFTDTLFENMLQCVETATKFQVDAVDPTECKLKIAYFKIINNNDIVRELHLNRSTCHLH